MDLQTHRISLKKTAPGWQNQIQCGGAGWWPPRLPCYSLALWRSREPAPDGPVFYCGGHVQRDLDGEVLNSNRLPINGPTPFQLEFLTEIQAFKARHPHARVTRPPELIAYGDDVTKRFETMTYEPEDFNRLVLEREDVVLIQRGVDMALNKCARERHEYRVNWSDTIKRMRALVQRVDIQFDYVESQCPTVWERLISVE